MPTTSKIEGTGSGVEVAVIDTGWDWSIADPRVRGGVGLSTHDDPPTIAQTADSWDRHGHGTSCANLILGLAPECRILPVRIFARARLKTTAEMLHNALCWVSKTDARVVNVSLGTYELGDGVALYEACESLVERNVVIVASASYADQEVLPASFDNVIAVGKGIFRSPLDFTWDCTRFPECRALGTPLPSCDANDDVHRAAASFAAARMSGIVARVLEAHPTAGFRDVCEVLEKAAIESEALSHDTAER